jgi:GNAT superfamily N-acetyltransferase
MVVEECKDIVRLLPIIDSWMKECNADTLNIKINFNEVLKDLMVMIDSPNATIFVLVSDSKVVGAMGMIIFKTPFGKQYIGNEHYWYVLPEYRGKDSLQLLLEGRKWAEEKGCSHFMANASMLASDLHDSVCKLYEKLGMTKYETSYIVTIGR